MSAAEAAPKPPPLFPRGSRMWVLGFVLPCAGFAAELGTGIFGGVAFTPFPTPWYLVAVAAALLSNVVVLSALNRPEPSSFPLGALCLGFSLAVSLFYALWFIPAIPLMVIGVIWMGLGLLAAAPYYGLIFGLRAWPRLHRAWVDGGGSSRRFDGLLVAGALLFAVPWAIVELGFGRHRAHHDIQAALSEDPEKRVEAIRSLRESVSASTLREVITRATTRHDDWGPEPKDWRPWLPSDRIHASPEELSEVHYLATGEPMGWAEDGWWRRFPQAMPPHGSGALGLEPKLRLTRMSVNVELTEASADAFVTWVLDLSNRTEGDLEALFHVGLPLGSCASRLTLWVNGEEREAAFDTREKVTKAYEDVAVIRRKDPALVNHQEPDSVAVRVFPVPAMGTQRVRLGFTIPIAAEQEGGLLVLPQLLDCNFEHRRHERFLFNGKERNGCSIAVASPAIDGVVQARDPKGVTVQRWTKIEREPPEAIVLVVDGSADLQAGEPAWRSFLESWPDDLPCVVHHAGDVSTKRSGDCADALEFLAGASFEGGVDSSRALLRAVLDAKQLSAPLYWIHGRSPMAFDAHAVLEPRHAKGVRVATLAVESGRNRVLERLGECARVFRVPRTENLEADGRRLARFEPLAGVDAFGTHRRELTREAKPIEGVPEVTDNLSRVWAYRESRQLLDAGKRNEAVELAMRYRLVTPVTGAVVLETEEQYERHELDPAADADVGYAPGAAAVPEPSTWLLILSGVLLLALARRR